MMKGWVDRVLQAGFAHGDLTEDGSPRRYGDGGLTGRKARIVVTTGDDKRTLGPRGVSGDLPSLLFPLTHGAPWYVGTEVLDLHVVHDADSVDPADREREAQRLTRRIAGISHERSSPYRRLQDGDYDRKTRALHNHIHPGRTDLGIHFQQRKSAPSPRAATATRTES